jgi:AraC-like DNA-binding protein
MGMGDHPPVAGVGSVEEWRRTISETYYQQDVLAEPGTEFQGRLAVWNLGSISISRIQSSALTYQRRRSQIVAQVDTHHLVTLPLEGDLFFRYQNSDLRCPPGSFLAERSDLPYELHQPGSNVLIVVKVPESLLHAHLPKGLAFKGQVVGSPAGVAGLFTDLVRSVPAHAAEIEPLCYPQIGRQILDLLTLALTSDHGALESGETSIQAAHLRRIKSFVKTRIFDPSLSPAVIAAGCGISARYLHRLFATTGTTVGRWIREERLIAGDDALRNPRWRGSIADLAQQCGFSDQPQFCRHYRSHFGRTPGETRAAARGRRLSGSRL